MSASWQVTSGSATRKHGNRGRHPTTGLSIHADFYTHPYTHTHTRRFLLLMKHFLQESYMRWISDEVALRRKALENWKKKHNVLICVEPLVVPSTSESCDDHMVGLGMWIYEYFSIRSGWTVFPVVCLWAREERPPAAIIAAAVKFSWLLVASTAFPLIRKCDKYARYQAATFTK